MNTPPSTPHGDDFQPRYLAYCAAHGKTPDEMLAHDDERWPGGVMCGYILWIGDRWIEWKVAVNWPKEGVIGARQHREFDAWLSAKFFTELREAA